jgi:hypothetical protein
MIQRRRGIVRRRAGSIVAVDEWGMRVRRVAGRGTSGAARYHRSWAHGTPNDARDRGASPSRNFRRTL